jgi:hypothetical protein
MTEDRLICGQVQKRSALRFSTIFLLKIGQNSINYVTEAKFTLTYLLSQNKQIG